MFDRAPDFVIGPSNDPYLERWWVIPRNKLFNIFLHHFLRSDDDMALHDHMYVNASIILSGRYIEHFLDGSTRLRAPWRPWAFWRVAMRLPSTAHRVALIEESPVWTIFVTGPRVRQWGFHCPKGWVHWKDFTDSRDNGLVGKGCED